MPYSTPTLSELIAQGQQDVANAGIPGVDALLRFAVLQVLATTQAGMSWEHYGYLAWIALQAVPWTSTDEYLAGWAALKGVFLETPTPASSTQVGFVATANSAPIASGTSVIRSDNVAYVTTADSILANGLAVVPVQAVLAGSGGNALAGVTMTLGSPVAGVQASGAFLQPATGGADVETQDDFRGRMIAAYQNPGRGGDAQDYVEWATDVSGVTRAWPNPNGFGPGTVVVYVMLDEANAAEGGFPQGSNGAAVADNRYPAATGDQLRVANAIYPLQPVTARVIVCAPIAQPINFVISDLKAGNTVVNQGLIATALKDMFLRISSPGGTIDPNAWNEAIASVSSVGTFNVPTPNAPVTAPTGFIPTLGTISFAT